jgi:hypothetical protein
MLFRETVAVYCKNHTEHTDTLCGQNAQIQCVKAGGVYGNHWALKGLNVHFKPMYIELITVLNNKQGRRERERERERDVMVNSIGAIFKSHFFSA